MVLTKTYFGLKEFKEQQKWDAMVWDVGHSPLITSTGKIQEGDNCDLKILGRREHILLQLRLNVQDESNLCERIEEINY